MIKYTDDYPEKVRQGCKKKRVPMPSAVRLKFEGNVLHAVRFRTSEENFRLAKIALVALIGYNPFEETYVDGTEKESTWFEINGGEIDFYRES